MLNRVLQTITVFGMLASTAFSQGRDEPPLSVVKSLKNYRLQVASDSNFYLAEVKTYIPNIIYDLRYATRNNFTGQQLYGNGRYTYLRYPVLLSLKKVQGELNQKGLGLKIFDAYRPHAVSRKMWSLIQDERYVANPANGSGHNRGIAVDLTLVDLHTGKELDMGTGFDHFSDTAHHGFQNVNQTVIANRALLKEIMERHGFRVLVTEWWHYSWPNDRNYPVMDIPVMKLKGRNNFLFK